MSETAVKRTGLCLSIQQPWAWLIIRPDVLDEMDRADLYDLDLIKCVENRSWPTKVRGWIGIHAGLKYDMEGDSWVRDVFPEIPLPRVHEFERGGIVGRANLVDCVETFQSRWFFGPYGFALDHVEPLPFAPCRGKLGFFRPELPR